MAKKGREANANSETKSQPLNGLESAAVLAKFAILNIFSFSVSADEHPLKEQQVAPPPPDHLSSNSPKIIVGNAMPKSTNELTEVRQGMCPPVPSSGEVGGGGGGGNRIVGREGGREGWGAS